jgi:hypothetical protein
MTWKPNALLRHVSCRNLSEFGFRFPDFYCPTPTRWNRGALVMLLGLRLSSSVVGQPSSRHGPTVGQSGGGFDNRAPGQVIYSHES